MHTVLFAQTNYNSDSGFMSAPMLIAIIVLAILNIVAVWKTYEKANHPGWGAIIPIYSTYILLKIAGRPAWWLLLYFIPIVNLIVHIIVSIDCAKAFGKSGTFGFFGLVLFPFIGFLMLGFGSATFKGSPQH